MLYQTLKFYVARSAVSLSLIFGLGFLVLFFLHEVALPNVEFDDSAIQWFIVLVCIFFGFVAYGMMGDQQFFNALHSLKNVSPKSKSRDIKKRFENILSFTYSSYFLPKTAKRYRVLGVLLYADYLLSIGDESSRALNIYVQAFLHSPRDSRFRKPLLSILNLGRELTQDEMDLLLLMVHQEEIHDPTLNHYLVGLFLKAGQWSGKIEPIFLSALENQSTFSDEIIRFALPIYLSHKRTDELALRFYLLALRFSVKEEDQIKKYLAYSYCEGNLFGVAPSLHHQCREIFEGMNLDQQAEIKRQSENNKISSKVKKVKLFRREDLQDLKRLKVEWGIVASRMTILGRWVRWLVRKTLSLFKWNFLQILEGLIKFGHLSIKTKLVSFLVLSVSIILVLSLSVITPKTENNLLSPPLAPVPALRSSHTHKEDRVYTIQIAAVISSKQADKFVRNLEKTGVEGLYVVKAIRRSGGYWYKIRAGQFPLKKQASVYANRLVDSNIIKNYFLIALPKN